MPLNSNGPLLKVSGILTYAEARTALDCGANALGFVVGLTQRVEDHMAALAHAPAPDEVIKNTFQLCLRALQNCCVQDASGARRYHRPRRRDQGPEPVAARGTGNGAMDRRPYLSNNQDIRQPCGSWRNRWSLTKPVA